MGPGKPMKTVDNGPTGGMPAKSLAKKMPGTEDQHWTKAVSKWKKYVRLYLSFCHRP